MTPRGCSIFLHIFIGLLCSSVIFFSPCQEAFTCTCLKVHPTESHFIAQSNGDYIALFSTRKPYKLNKFKGYEGHKVMTPIISGFNVTVL